ncbi:MAG TPA: hypothetical protein VM889_04290 [Candidatus Thermoplasmatota archaeon]|nr:hypothetical protein [Candidatus Thermoplasmatota archaeon]
MEDHARGLGLTVAEVRALHPAAEVRRTAVLETLRRLEELGLVSVLPATRDRPARYRWIGPLPDDARPFGLDMRRVNRDQRLAPEERVEASALLSQTFLVGGDA